MKYVPLVITLFLFVTGCAKFGKEETTTVEPDIRGKWISERQYANDYFGFTITIPEEWSLTYGENEYLMDAATEFVSGEDKNYKKSLDIAVKKAHMVFMASQYPLGTPGKNNPNANMIIESISHLPGIQTADDYLLALEDTLAMSDVDITFLSKPESVELGGVEFSMRKIVMPMGQIEVSQTAYAKKMDGYILLFNAVIVSEDDEPIMKALTDSISTTGN